MTQDQLADKLGTTRQTISRYENGDRKTTQDVLFELAGIFHKSVNDFFPDEDNRAPSTADVVAAHIDDDTSETEQEQIINFIEALKKARNQD
ncbi:hypothetical protein FC96_GL001332 [Secundilactobacillus kimchicus JCM 15530]|uniref:HTH cro/C1-type domain-containing protein n=2 Tax=Secundilactobacillus kimchicus TaxID=528209 RepID=A0A0R1HZP7_9LACO|nr:hypothetical protein FC96_GL001332 [Secundilactobacillus kimchicus JCM 15530]